VDCGSPLCAAIQEKPRHPCFDPFKLCVYHETYADALEARGFLVEDSIPIESSDRTLQHPEVAFGWVTHTKDFWINYFDMIII